MTKLERSNCDQTQNSDCAKLKKIKLWQLKNSNCDGNNNDSSDRSSYIDIFLVKKHLNTLTTDELSGQLFATLAMFNRPSVAGAVL